MKILVMRKIVSDNNQNGNLNARYSLVFNVDANSFYGAFFEFIINSEEGTLE